MMRHALKQVSACGRRSLLRREFSASGFDNRLQVVLGAQWGDEGKGKLVDVLASQYDIVARFNGGNNAGHTLVVDGKKYAFHLLPCGLLYDNVKNVIGNGCVVHVKSFKQELDNLIGGGINPAGRLFVSNRAQIVFDFHQVCDGISEDTKGAESIGTTKKGIGPAYASKMTRNGLRMGDLMGDWDSFEKRYLELYKYWSAINDFDYDTNEELARFKEYKEMLKPMVLDTSIFLNQAYNSGKKILAEGANAVMLDIDHGTYPMVTSSGCVLAGVSQGLGMPPNVLAENHGGGCIGVVKAYTTRVGMGPFPTELGETELVPSGTCSDPIGKHIGDVGHEYGTTTKRRRRCGWLDIPLLQYSHMLNGYTSINITKLDVLSELEELCVGHTYRLDGEALDPGAMPSTMDDLSRVTVDYDTLPGWMSDISECKTFEDLPKNAQDYLTYIEEKLGVPISWVGVGVGRTDMATRGFTWDQKAL